MTTEPKHTPEPWEAIGSRSDRAIISAGRSIARVWGAIQPDDRPPHDQADANAARIVACINACAGIPTAQLEAGCVRRLAEAAKDLDLVCIFDPINPCWDARPNDVAGKHWGGGRACSRCGTKAALAPFQEIPQRKEPDEQL